MSARVLVTGGTGLIGRAVLTHLRDAGHRVITTGRRTRPADLDPDIRYLRTPAGDHPAASTGILITDQVRTHWGALDAALLNTGTIAHSRLLDTSADVAHALTRANLTDQIDTLRALVPLLRDGHRPLLILTGSSASLRTEAEIGWYSVTKRALHAVANLAAAELAPHIRVLLLCPGDIAPGMAPSRASGADPFTTVPPMRRLGTADDVAAQVTALVTARHDFVTGCAVQVDGGLLAARHGWAPR
jgi:NAD(P)-dependent dehydrogenase (short-subunit alcohol dehydrogenase family)